MSEMVERVARALAEIEDTAFWRDYIPHARAALGAMREPPANYYDFGTDKMWKDKTSADVWAAMIDAALKEPA